MTDSSEPLFADLGAVNTPLTAEDIAQAVKVITTINDRTIVVDLDASNVLLPREPRGRRVPGWIGWMMGIDRAESDVSLDPPRWALRCFSVRDALHYEREWSAHLWELAEAGEHRRARRDRRSMALNAPWLALKLHVRARRLRRASARR